MRGDGSLATHIKTILILQEHIAVGVEVAQNLRGIGIIDLVPDHGRGRGLDKGRRFALPDIETLPVDKSTAGGLMDGELRTCRVERCRTRGHRAARWVGLHAKRDAEPSQQKHCESDWSAEINN